MTADGVFLGLDVGTTSVKVLACARDGTVPARAKRGYPLDLSTPGRAEQDANALTEAAFDALRETVAALAERAIFPVALGFSCAMHGLVALDAADEPLGPLLTWMDRRAAAVAAAWRADGSASELYRRTGVPVHPMLPSCKLRFLARAEPALVARAARFVSIKERIVHRLTGSRGIDAGLAAGTGLCDPRTRRYDATALAAAEVDVRKLGEIMPPSTRLALTPAGARASGLPRECAIVLGSSDGACANLGSGAIDPTTFAATLGTSGAVRVVSPDVRLDPQERLFCYPFDDARSLVGGPTNGAGAALRAIFALFYGELPEGERTAAALAAAAIAPPGARGLTFLPWLAGERAPYWRADLRGALLGLTFEHGRADVARAAFEGVVGGLAAVLDAMRETVGAPREVRLSGGVAQAPLVQEIAANRFGCEVLSVEPDEASAFGAALFAALAVDAVPDVTAVARLVRVRRREAPTPDRLRAYAAVGDRYAAAAERWTS